MNADAFVLGLHLLSFHSQDGYDTVTPGMYLMHKDTGITAGALRNSESRFGWYAAETIESRDHHWALSMGAIHGYDHRPWLPLLVPSYRFDSGVRISVIPNPWGAKALHLSYEFTTR